MLNLVEYSKRSSLLKEKVQKEFSAANMDFDINRNKTDSIRLVFAGQYSAGKSTILKMLTGRDDIDIGAGITTQQAHTYNWNGIEVIDTPGIHTELRPDHDEISYEAIASADMLVFVITNELFDSHIAEHFRKLAVDKDKAGEMILAVNKMERAAEGNSAAQRDVIREDLRKVLVPYTPEQLNLSFLDAESYLDGVEEMEADPEVATELIDRSGYNEFVKTLNCFVESKSISSKLTTELYVIDGYLEKAIKQLQPKSVDEDIDALEESFIQQRHLFIEARGRMQNEVKDIYTTAAAKIRDIGLEAANLLVDGCNQSDVEAELEKSVKKVDSIVEQCQVEAANVVDARLNEIGQCLEDLENTEFSVSLKSRLSGKFEGLPEGIQKVLSEAGEGFQSVGKKVVSGAYKAGSKGGLKLTSFSGSTLHQSVLKVGHAIGYKFRPWQAVKLTKGLAIGGQILSFLGVGVSVFMQIKADRDEEKINKALKNNRQNIRSQFNTAASELEDYGRQFVKDNVNSALEDSIKGLDSSIQEIRNSRSTRSDICRRLEALQGECQLLIQDIHSNSSEEIVE